MGCLFSLLYKSWHVPLLLIPMASRHQAVQNALRECLISRATAGTSLVNNFPARGYGVQPGRWSMGCCRGDGQCAARAMG